MVERTIKTKNKGHIDSEGSCFSKFVSRTKTIGERRRWRINAVDKWRNDYVQYLVPVRG